MDQITLWSLECALRDLVAAGRPAAVADAAIACADACAALDDHRREWEHLRTAAEALITTGSYTSALRIVARMQHRAGTPDGTTAGGDDSRGDDAGTGPRRARTLALRSAVLRCQRRFPEAIGAAHRAVDLLDATTDYPEYRSEVYQALIAALVESGRIAEAWDHHRHLAQSLEQLTDESQAGRGFWTLGNLAFTVGNPLHGVEYHERAGQLLSPSNDVLQWARFNKASADLQLQAGFADQRTADCIERAVLAYGAIDAGPAAQLELTITRGRWLRAIGRASDAVALLEEAERSTAALEPAEFVPLYQLWADLLEELGERGEAADRRRLAAEHDLRARNESA